MWSRVEIVQLWFICACALYFASASCTEKLNKLWWPELQKAAASNSYPTVVVDKSGQGQFSTVQAAIDSVPAGNKKWIRISIRAGTYREQVNIPLSKPFLLLQGEGMMKTQVVWDGHGEIEQATFRSSAENVVAINVGFVNSYNYPGYGGEKRDRLPAVAAMIEGGKSAFYSCGFFGVQDSLWDALGTHYYLGCTIIGAVDFIFGAARSLYEQCHVTVADVLPPGVEGYITAQARQGANDESGFVFKNCDVKGAPAFLGRAWGPYAMVIFYQTELDDAINPLGWYSWHYSGHEKQFTFAEVGNKGIGSDTARRVPWVKKLSPQAAAQYATLDFIQAGTWLENQPKPSRILLN